MSTLYENIKSLCDERGIKGGKMCVDLGLSKSLMTGLKTGRKKSIQIETAAKIANYFSVPVDSILTPEPGTIDVDALDLDGKPEVEVVSEQKKEPVPTNGNGLADSGYNQLTPDNQRMIDDLIEKLLRSQSGS